MKMGFKEAIFGTRIGELQELADFPAWAEQSIEQESLVVELSFRGIRAPLTVSGDALQPMDAFLRWSRFLGRLHKVARATNSDFVLDPDATYEKSDYADVALAYALLEGGRTSVEIDSIDVTLHEDAPKSMQGEFLVTTTILFTVGGKPLCSLPVRFELPGYELVPMPDSGRHRITKGPNAEAWATYAEGEVFDGEMSRPGSVN